MGEERRPRSDPTAQPFDDAEAPEGYVTLQQPTLQGALRGQAIDAAPDASEGGLYRYQTRSKHRNAIKQRYGSDPSD